MHDRKRGLRCPLLCPQSSVDITPLLAHCHQRAEGQKRREIIHAPFFKVNPSVSASTVSITPQHVVTPPFASLYDIRTSAPINDSIALRTSSQCSVGHIICFPEYFMDLRLYLIGRSKANGVSTTAEEWRQWCHLGFGGHARSEDRICRTQSDSNTPKEDCY
jgi:hypothetical protein